MKTAGWDYSLIDLNEVYGRVLGHMDMYDRWLSDFFGGQLIDNAEAALRSDDRDAAHKAVHKLKGTAANLAVLRVASVAMGIDERVKGGEPLQEIRARIPELRKEFAVAETMYNEYKDFVKSYVAD